MFPLAVGSIRARIFAIALLAFAPPAIFATVLAIEEVRDAQAEAESHLNAATRALADRYKRVFGSISETLTILADRPRIQRAAMVRGLECREILQGYAEIINRGALVKYTNIALNDVSTGLPLCSALTGPSTEGVGRAPWLQRIVETGEIGFGGYRIGVVTGRPILIAGTLVRDNDGRPAGVLLLAADLAGASAADHLLPTVPGLAATVFSGAGMVLFQYPETDLIGRSLHDASLVEFSGGIGEAGVYEGLGFDGVDRIFAVRRLDAPEPTFVAVGQLLDEVKRASDPEATRRAGRGNPEGRGWRLFGTRRRSRTFRNGKGGRVIQRHGGGSRCAKRRDQGASTAADDDAGKAEDNIRSRGGRHHRP